MRAIQAKIQHVPSGTAPDEYTPSPQRIPPGDFVVSRNLDGSPASCYRDLEWDRTAYSADGCKFSLCFQFWKAPEATERQLRLTDEMRWLLFLLIYRRSGRAYSNTSLRGYLDLLSGLARYCDMWSMRMADLLADPVMLPASVAGRGGAAILLMALIRVLWELGPEVVGFSVADRKTVEALNRAARVYSDGLKQHPPIPTRLYSAMLAVLNDELRKFELIADRVINVLTEWAKDPFVGKYLSDVNRWRRRVLLGKDVSRPTFETLLKKHDLESYWIEQGWDRTSKSFEALLTRIRVTAALQIQAYTGMRIGEVELLPHTCLSEVVRGVDQTIHYIVRGKTTKHSNGKIRRVQWVTNRSGKSAIELAQRISSVIYRAIGETPTRAQDRLNSYHLFVSTAFIFTPTDARNAPAHVTIDCAPDLRDKLQLVIEDEDLCELEHIDPHRAWRSEDAFQVGRPWTFTCHQLRRSLALYAHRSGLVTLPSLKRQLQHLTQEMASYYCKGSTFAKDFLGSERNDRHFGKEWQKTQPISQFLGYVAQVFLTDEKLFGVHQHWVKTRLADEEGNIVFDRAKTMSRFRKGEMAFRETLLGGCVKVGRCDKNPLNFLQVECVTEHCKNLVGNEKKLQRVVFAQEKFVQALEAADVYSPEFRHEKANLEMLKQTLANVSSKSTDVSECT